MTNETLEELIAKASISNTLKFALTELSRFIDYHSDNEEINEHYQSELHLVLTDLDKREMKK